MSDVKPEFDPAPHATPDQIRAAAKRREAAAAASGEIEARTAAPKGRRSTPSDEA
jgi:hypothetical protein